MIACSDDHWHTLWDVFNTNRTDDIRVPRDALADVLACHGETPDGLIAVQPKASSSSVLVNRAALFLFLNHHGGRCSQGVAA